MSVFRRTVLPQDETLMKAAVEALTQPPDSWFSDPDLFYSWGLTIGTHRDDDLMGASNFERITEDMQRTFPADTAIVRSSHWAVGWAEQLSVRVIEPWADPRNFSVKDITRAFAVITSVALSLVNHYPLYDETDYMEREYLEMVKNRETAWDDTVYALWLKYDVEKDDVTDADREVFDQAWEAADEYYGSTEAYVDRNVVAAAIMAARAGQEA